MDWSTKMSLNGTLHHVEINVSDLEKSRSFYEWFLTEMGYVAYQNWPKGFSYRKEQTYLVFVQTEPKHLQHSFHRSATGLNHVAFHCDQALIRKIALHLKEKGIPLLYPDQYPYPNKEETTAIFFEDPDRIKIECASY